MSLKEEKLMLILEEEGVELLRVTRGETNKEKWSRRKDMARFLGVASTTLDRRKDTNLSFKQQSCSQSSSHTNSKFDSVMLSRNFF